MRILIVPKEFPSAHNPNAGIFILRRAQALRDLGHDIAVLRFVPAAPPIGSKWNAYREIPKNETIEGIPVKNVRAIIPPRMIAMEYVPLFLRTALEREIRRFNADLVHASFLLPCGQLAVRQRMVPSIVTAHGVDAYRWPRLRRGLWNASREAVAKADGVTAVSGYIARCLRELASRDVRVIWNGGDERFFYPRDRQASRRALNLPLDRQIVAFAGNVLRQKGLFDLLQALHEMRPEQRPLLVVAGSGGAAAELQARAAELRVQVTMLGTVTSEKIAELFGAADLVTLPSHAEGLPNVLCEAMLCARAIVATTVGGIPEIIEDGRTGLLVAPHSPQDLTRALETGLSRESLRSEMAAAARDFAEQYLTWRVSARAYETFFREVLALAATIPRADQLRIPNAAR